MKAFLNNKDCRHLRNRLRSYFEELLEKEKTNPYLIWTESDVQSYLYHRLVSDPQINRSYLISNRPVLSSVNPEKKYKGKAKSVKPFYQPDILVTPLENLKVEQRKTGREEKRMELIRKDDSVAIEIKFVQDTNDSTGRKSVAKLHELERDYEKNKREGHKHIILVFVEKGEKSYLSKEDINRMSKYRGFLVFHKPKKSFFN